MAIPFLQNSVIDTGVLLPANSPDKYRAVRALWDGYSGATGLLDARNGYKYSPITTRYSQNGTRVTDKQLRQYVNNISTQASLEMRKNTQQLIAGIIIASVWYSRMQNLMETLYRTIWLVSIGGFLFDDDLQRNLFYLFVLSQFRWLDNFYTQILSELQPLDGRAIERAGMYGTYGNGLFQNILLNNALAEGKTQARRVLGKNENHCTDNKDGSRRGCIELAKEGWVNIRSMIPIGDAVCYSHCHCHILYR